MPEDSQPAADRADLITGVNKDQRKGKDVRQASVESATESVDRDSPIGTERRIRKPKRDLQVPFWKRCLLWPTVVILGVYFTMMAVLAANETGLVYPGSAYPKGYWGTKLMEYEEIDFESEDGTELIGWFLPSRWQVADRPCRTVLICHGNGENCSEVAVSWGRKFQSELHAEVFSFDYRGFGKCEGTPCESGVLEDSEAAMNWLCQRTGKSHDDIIVVGHSLGGGPAVHLAHKFGCKMLILQRTFTSLPDAAAANYPIFPVHWIMQNRMNSLDKIASCPQPLFQSHGSEDRLIPIALGRQLFDASPATQKQFFTNQGQGHLDALPNDYWVQLTQFVDAADAIDAGAFEKPEARSN